MKRLRIVLSTTLSACLLMMSPMAVFALSGTDNTGSGSDSATPTTVSADDKKPLTAEQLAQKAAELKKRLDDNKAALKTKIDDATKKRIIAKCKPAQTIVKGAETSANAISTNRGKAYSKISEKIQTLIDKVKAQGIDTTVLEAANTTAKQKAETLSASMKTYEQTLADLQAMDCATDPTAFQASLVIARTQRETVKTQAQDLRTYISTTLKDAIKAVRKQIEPTESETNKSDDSTETKPTTTGGTQ